MRVEQKLHSTVALLLGGQLNMKELSISRKATAAKAGQRDVEQTKSVLRVEKPLRRARGQVSFPHH